MSRPRAYRNFSICLPRGQSGMYGHCHLKGNSIVHTASATEVKVSGLRECISIFCSVRISSSTCRQFSEPRLSSNCLKLAALLGRGKSSGCVRMTLSWVAVESWRRILGKGNGTSSKSWRMYLSTGIG